RAPAWCYPLISRHSRAPWGGDVDGKCGSPPVIENGDLLSFPMQEYPEGATLEYKCPNLYVLEGSQYITCTDGQWTSPPVCLVACTASEEDMGRNNIELKWITGRKLYSRSGDFIEFRCKRGYLEDPASSSFRVECVEGTLEYPQCKPKFRAVCQDGVITYPTCECKRSEPRIREGCRRQLC
uniref:Sushi domain-containing protein n=1 Tax=Strigops habroptila TaxID=2489341 RepID=A0A672U7R9_STRHB